MQPKYEHTFRQSWLGTYWECPEQARLVLRGEYPHDQTEAAAKGTATHAAIEAVIERGLGFAEALQVGVDVFRELSADEQFRWVQVKREATCLKHIEGGLLSWWNHVLPTLGATIWCEQSFKFVVYEDAERVIYVSGTVDYADAPNGLEDWKLTSNQDKYGRDGWKLVKYGVQPSVYAVAARHMGLYGQLEDVPFTWVALNPQGRKPQLLSCVRTPAEQQWLIHQLVQLSREIERGTDHTWPLRDQSALCSPKWCLNYAACKGVFLQDA